MVTVETFKGYRITVGMGWYNPEKATTLRYCEVKHVESGVPLGRHEFPSTIPVEAVLEAARRAIEQHSDIPG
jgi:hypothetical protein